MQPSGTRMAPPAAHMNHACLDADMDRPLEAACAGGMLALMSRRSPGKQTPNEDAAAWIEVGGAAVLAVADGVGGARGGDRAARLAIETLLEGLVGIEDVDSLRTHVIDAIELANRRILDLQLGAGTTLVVMEVIGDEVRPYHVGDSTALVIGGRGRMKLETVSHSPVGFALEAGVLDAEEAMHHEDRNIVSNLVGTPDMRIEMGARLRLAPRDTVLLVTDGLCDNLRMPEIIDIARRGAVASAVETLVARARERMEAPGLGHPSKPDDCTVLAFRRSPSRS